MNALLKIYGQATSWLRAEHDAVSALGCMTNATIDALFSAQGRARH
jgi:hypothetical protein